MYTPKARCKLFVIITTCVSLNRPLVYNFQNMYIKHINIFIIYLSNINMLSILSHNKMKDMLVQLFTLFKNSPKYPSIAQKSVIVNKLTTAFDRIDASKEIN